MGVFLEDFPDAQKSFKYNGNSRKKHELSHEPPVVVPDNNYSIPTSSQVLPCKSDDDVFSYNTALLSEGLKFALTNVRVPKWN